MQVVLQAMLKEAEGSPTVRKMFDEIKLRLRELDHYEHNYMPDDEPRSGLPNLKGLQSVDGSI